MDVNVERVFVNIRISIVCIQKIGAAVTVQFIQQQRQKQYQQQEREKYQKVNQKI